jgi:hypothetical protein
MLICQLTDLHVRPVGKPASRVCETNMFTERAFRAVARLNPRPDVVLITGDELRELNADFRGRPTCLFHTQLSSVGRAFSPSLDGF